MKIKTQLIHICEIQQKITVFKEKFIVLNAYIRGKRSKIIIQDSILGNQKKSRLNPK